MTTADCRLAATRSDAADINVLPMVVQPLTARANVVAAAKRMDAFMGARIIAGRGAAGVPRADPGRRSH